MRGGLEPCTAPYLGIYLQAHGPPTPMTISSVNVSQILRNLFDAQGLLIEPHIVATHDSSPTTHAATKQEISHFAFTHRSASWAGTCLTSAQRAHKQERCREVGIEPSPHLLQRSTRDKNYELSQMRYTTTVTSRYINTPPTTTKIMARKSYICV